MFEENVIQPALVTLSCIKLSSEVVRMILKIDDIVISR
jgi:chaperonin GroEL (HSP60 family)